MLGSVFRDLDFDAAVFFAAAMATFLLVRGASLGVKE